MGLSNAVIRFRPTTAMKSAVFLAECDVGRRYHVHNRGKQPIHCSLLQKLRFIPMVLIVSMSFFISSFGQLNIVLAEKALQFDILQD